MSPLTHIDAVINRPGKKKNESRTESSTYRRSRDTNDVEERPPLSFNFRENRVPVTYNSSIAYDEVLWAIDSKPFQAWIDKASRVCGSKCIKLYGVHIESVNIIDGRIDYINMRVMSDLVDEDDKIGNKEIKGVCCLRDSAVGILIELRCIEDDSIWSVLVDQPRINVGAVSALELPVAILDDDDESLIGAEIREVEQSCGLSLKQSDMINLTQRAYEKNCVHNASGLCPSLGNCSEFIRIMYVKKEITRHQLKKIRTRLSQTREEGASMSLRVMPLADMWKVSADMKVVCALFLLERAGLPEKTHHQEKYYTVDDNENRGTSGVRNKINRILSFSKRPFVGQY